MLAHEAVHGDQDQPVEHPSSRLLVRDGSFWSPDLELVLDVVGYGSLIALPLGHSAAEEAMRHAEGRVLDLPVAVVRAENGRLTLSVDGRQGTCSAVLHTSCRQAELVDVRLDLGGSMVRATEDSNL